jgi:hypothetical protein
MYSFELPSGTELELREMTGAEEELLTNQRLIRSGEAINQVLRNCFVRLGEKTDPDLAEVMNLLSGDRLFALVRLRQISLGDEVELELSCPNSACRMTNFVTINLEDLKVTPYGEEREFAFKLPGSKKAVRFEYLDGHKEKRLASLREPHSTAARLSRILDIDVVRYDRTGNETRRWTLHGAWVKALEYDELEGGNTENTIEKLTICFQYWT